MEKNFVITDAQEMQELAQLNACTEKNRAALEAAHAARVAANRKRYNIRTVCEIGGLMALGAAVACAGFANLIAPVIVAPVLLASVCLSFLRFGVWIGRH